MTSVSSWDEYQIVDEFQIVEFSAPQRALQCWAYENHDLPHWTFNSTMWLSDSYVKFQSKGKITKWHGYYVKNPGEMEIYFDCKGRKKWKSTYVLETAPGIFEGRDYRRRRITMRLLTNYIRDADDEYWIVVQAVGGS